MALVIYYEQQIQDTVSLLFSMISSRASLELRQCLVTALKLIMKKNKDAISNHTKNTRLRSISVSLVQPNLALLLDADPGMNYLWCSVKMHYMLCIHVSNLLLSLSLPLAIRADFALFLITYLEQISETNYRHVNS